MLSISRIFGPPFFYLMLWGWTIGALMVVALVVSVASVARPLVRNWGGAPRRIAAAALAGIFVGAGWGFSAQAADTAHPAGRESALLAQLVPKTVTAIKTRRANDPRFQPPFLVTWYDPISLGSLGYGLMNELERAGLAVGTVRQLRVAVRDHRVLHPGGIGGVVHIATGRAIVFWEARPSATRVAYYDPRSPLQRVLSRDLRAQAVQALEEAGFKHPDRLVEDSAFTLSSDARVSVTGQRALQGFIALGLPTAVFVEHFDPDAAPSSTTS